MIDLFGGVDYAKFRETVKLLGEHHATLLAVLLEKGLVSEADIYRMKPRIEQMLERAERQANKEYLEENPAAAVLAKLMGVEFPLPVESAT